MKYFKALVVTIVSFWLGNAAMAQNTIVIKDSNLQGNQTYNWTKNNVYILDGIVFLENGGRLNIEAGTVIRAKRQPSASTGYTASGLIIAKGAKIYANGTEENPIVFTVEGDNLSKPNDFTKGDRGLWYGVAVLGKGVVSAIIGSPGGVTSYLPHVGPAPFPSTSFEIDSRATFGGNNDADNSGKLSFVSIRHSSAGLYLAGVGSNTVIDHVEVFAAKDGIKIWGGKVNAKYVAAHFISHNAYSLAYGWRGLGMHWTSVQGKNATGPAVALEGYEPFEYYYAFYDAFYEPEVIGRFTKPTIYHGTFVGGDGSSGNSNYPVALSFVNNAAGTIGNSIFVNFPGKGIFISDITGWDSSDSYARLQRGDLKLISNVWSQFGGGNQFNTGFNGIIDATYAEHPSAPALVNHLNNSKNTILPSIVMASRPDYTTTLLDIRLEKEWEYLLWDKVAPLPNQAFFSHSFYSDPFYENCPLQGAIFPEFTWLPGWTAIDQNKLLYTKPYIEYNEEVFQFDNINISCMEYGDFKQSFLVFYPEFVCGNDQIYQIASANRRTRGEKSTVTKQLVEFCFVNKKLEIYYIEYEKCLDLYACPGKWVTGTITVKISEDSCPPIVRVVPYATDDVPSDWSHSFYLEIEDVSTSWVKRETVNSLYYEWTIIDSCKNETIFRLPRNILGTYRNWYADVDSDGYGDPNVVFSWTSRPPGYVSNAGDCNDSNPAVNPAQNENPNTIEDDDCSGCAAGPLRIYTEDILMLPHTIIPVNGELTSSAVVLNQQQITFRSNEVVILKPGFTAQAGSKFTAQIRPCPNDLSDEPLVKQRSDSIPIVDSHFDLALNIYPNPAANQFTIDIHLPELTSVVLSLHDMQGRKLQDILSGKEMLNGTYQISVNLGELSAGVYYIEMRTLKGRIVERVVLLSDQ